MSARCRRCEAELGPWEGRMCLKCSSPGHTGRRLSLADLALIALERADAPLSVYDISRTIQRDSGTQVHRGSLMVNLSDDRRFCWAGKGLYGLYRHRLFP